MFGQQQLPRDMMFSQQMPPLQGRERDFGQPPMPFTSQMPQPGGMGLGGMPGGMGLGGMPGMGGMAGFGGMGGFGGMPGMPGMGGMPPMGMGPMGAMGRGGLKGGLPPMQSQFSPQPQAPLGGLGGYGGAPPLGGGGKAPMGGGGKGGFGGGGKGGGPAMGGGGPAMGGGGCKGGGGFGGGGCKGGGGFGGSAPAMGGGGKGGGGKGGFGGPSMGAPPPPSNVPAQMSINGVATWSYGQSSTGPAMGGKGGKDGGGKGGMPGMGMGGMGMGMSMGGGSDMGQFIKTGQRVSQSWKAAWQGYCMVNGTGKFDPAGYDSNFISGFIEYVGSLALNDMGGPPPMAMVGDKRAGVWGAPPAKRAAIMGGMGMGGGDPQLADLVSRVKSVQKSDLAGKEAWWSFCDTSLGGVKDPSRHDAATLQQFLTQYGA